MAIVNIPKSGIKLTQTGEVTACLSSIGIDYERWDTDEVRVSHDASEQDILEAYSSEISKLMARGGYVTADVINIIPTTPNLQAMLDKFNREHWHDEDEVRFIVKGHGLFHIAPKDSEVLSIEMEAGDMIRVPKDTLHWFNLCKDKTVRAIRLFEDSSGWTPHYTGSGVEQKYQPLCFGLDHIPFSPS